ncbi:hypothetical protein EHS25_002615 [Saitozyma podzolica]|uniref:Uncharacterized protein n=1 Tax=Saitozyma podzolica TaxID=1890683 RepID=A0A427YD18_9TREE|nr:hypothetical protein EHS25_002615 [Saitozyma podzolica]
MDESTDPVGLAERPAPDLPLAEGILLPIMPLFSLVLRKPPITPAVLGSSVGRRFPISPPRMCDADEVGGPEVPNGWVGTSGAAEGLLNFAMRSLSDPETMRCCGPAPAPAPAPGPVAGVLPADEEREDDSGGGESVLGSVILADEHEHKQQRAPSSEKRRYKRNAGQRNKKCMRAPRQRGGSDEESSAGAWFDGSKEARSETQDES